MLPGYYGYRNMVLGFSQYEYYTYENVLHTFL